MGCFYGFLQRGGRGVGEGFMIHGLMKKMKGLREVRKQMIAQMEQKLHESWSSEEDSLFYYHRSEGFNPCIIAIPYQGILNLGDDPELEGGNQTGEVTFGDYFLASG